MLADYFFHPDHVVPTVEFVTALVELSDCCKAQMRVKIGTVFGEVFVFYRRIADASI